MIHLRELSFLYKHKGNLWENGIRAIKVWQYWCKIQFEIMRGGFSQIDLKRGIQNG